MKAFVAVVSSEPDFLERATALLEADGHIVAPYARAELALQAFESINFDILICTLVLGTSNGFALAEAAQARIPRLQVLLASRVRRQAVANAAASARFVDHELTLDAFHQGAQPAAASNHKARKTLDDIQQYLQVRLNG